MLYWFVGLMLTYILATLWLHYNSDLKRLVVPSGLRCSGKASSLIFISFSKVRSNHKEVVNVIVSYFFKPLVASGTRGSSTKQVLQDKGDRVRVCR